MTPTYDEIHKAASMLIENGICLSIPGSYSIHTPDQAASFCSDPDAYYRVLNIAAAEEQTERFNADAQKVGASFEDYIHFCEYQIPYRIIEWRHSLNGGDGHCCFPGDEGSPYCSGTNKNGERCRRTVEHYGGKFSEFRRGVHDRCSLHKEAAR